MSPKSPLRREKRKMEKVVFNEVYDILNCIDIKYRKNIPDSLMSLIKSNRELFYETNIKELPENLDDLKYDTKVFLGLIYKKYFMNTNLDISDIEKQKIQNSLKIIEITKTNKNIKLYNDSKNSNLVTAKKSNNILEKIIDKIKSSLKK